MVLNTSESTPWEAYRTTTYRMKETREGVVNIRLDERSPRPGPMAYITADNPGSIQLSDQENKHRRAALNTELSASSYDLVAGESVDDLDQWPTERGFWVCGIDRDRARSVGRRFDQHAIVFVDASGAVELVDCRRPPSTRSQRVLESLRLGVVPDGSVDHFSVGRHDEMQEVDEELEAVSRGSSGLRTFLADYGVGKTHLLELIRERAMARGFLCARVVLDTVDIAPSHPGRVYRALMSDLRYPDRPSDRQPGLRRLFEQALNAPDARQLFWPDEQVSWRDRQAQLAHGEHLYLTPALSHFDQLKQLDDRDTNAGEKNAVADLLLRWIEGRPFGANRDLDARVRQLSKERRKIYSLKDYRPWARIYAYLLSGLAELARSCGYKGLVILVDEAERHALLSKQNRHFAQTLFQALAAATLPEEELPFERHGFAEGGYGILRELPARFAEGRGLYVAMAMTPASEEQRFLDRCVPAAHQRELSILSGSDFDDLAQRVIEIYIASYPHLDWPDQLWAPLRQIIVGLYERGLLNTPREAMKFLVEFLDITRHDRCSVGLLIDDLRRRLR